ncbi:hypothetical protein ACQPX6_29135 [Actinomycetospora sp. CA-101289]|uniref:hypothetical protein n=1 Tax=Actinomycetospora sp. CA-101289 TaxID=3239893 RepID=UPI003D9893F5
MHIRTDDDVYRVDAVWLGPPRATFPWRARYSAYGVGLLVMLAVMFVQRRLGIDLGFFSVAWALLITVAVTRFVSRRINDERPLLEWLTLFVHELRGPRAKQGTIGGALTTGHVAVRRDRPKLTGAPTAVALPRGSEGRVVHPTVRAGASEEDAAWGPPPREDEEGVASAGSPRVAEPRAAEPAPEPEPPVVPGPRRAERDGHLTPDLDAQAGGAHRRARTAGTATPAGGERRRPARPRRGADAGFGPPESADIGDPVRDGAVRPASLPPAPDPRTAAAAEASVAAWTGGTAGREPVPAPRSGRRIDRAGRPDAGDPDRTQRRPARPRRRPGWPMSNEPAGGDGAPFGPGARSRGARGDDGAAPR